MILTPNAFKLLQSFQKRLLNQFDIKITHAALTIDDDGDNTTNANGYLTFRYRGKPRDPHIVYPTYHFKQRISQEVIRNLIDNKTKDVEVVELTTLNINSMNTRLDFVEDSGKFRTVISMSQQIINKELDVDISNSILVAQPIRSSNNTKKRLVDLISINGNNIILYMNSSWVTSFDLKISALVPKTKEVKDV